MELGAPFAALAAASAVIAANPPSRVAAVLDRAEPRRAAPRARAALAAALAAAAIALATPLGPVAAPAAAYAVWIARSIVRDRDRARRQRELARASRDAIEWLEVLVASGHPPEAAIARVLSHGVGSDALDPVLADVARAYALGAPLYPALADAGARAGATALAALARDLAQARELGRAALVAIRGSRDALREDDRARAVAAAAAVEPRLTLVLVLCYLPALLLAVVIPLFLGLLRAISA